MKPEEQRVLGILATIFGAIALLGSWIPFINYLSLFIGIVAFILGIIGLIVNLKKRKTMTIIGTSLAVASVVLFFTTQVYTLMSTKSMPGSFTVPTWIRMPQWNAKKKAARQTIPSPGLKNSSTP